VDLPVIIQGLYAEAPNLLVYINKLENAQHKSFSTPPPLSDATILAPTTKGVLASAE